MIEHVARALYEHHGDCFPKSKGGWAMFCELKPDVAQIYRDNARVAIEAMQSAP
jgi:hypothetical protein